MDSVNLGTAAAYIKIDTTGFEHGAMDAERRAKSLAVNLGRTTSEMAKTIGRNMQLAGAGIAAGLGFAVKGAADFDQALRNVNSIAKLSEQQFGDLRKQVLGLTKDPSIRQGPTDLAKGLYDVYSSGFQGAKALDVLRVSALGASAGMTDTTTSGKALMAVLNSGIKGTAGNAKTAMDVLFKIVDRGVGSFSELSGSIGQVIGTASKAGVSIQEIGAFLAVASKGGQTFGDATNDLLNLLTKLIRPSDEAAKLMKSLGISYGLSALQAKGLTGILAEMTAKTRGHDDILAKLFPDMQAFRALLTSMQKGGADYAAELSQMSKATDGIGAAQSAANEQNKGAVAQYEKLKQQVQVLAVEIGGHLLPVGVKLLEWVRRAAEAFNALRPETQETIVKFAALGAGTLILGGYFITLTTNVLNLRSALIASSPGLITWIGLIGRAAGVLGTLLVLKQAYDAGQAAKYPSHLNAQPSYEASDDPVLRGIPMPGDKFRPGMKKALQPGPDASVKDAQWYQDYMRDFGAYQKTRDAAKNKSTLQQSFQKSITAINAELAGSVTSMARRKKLEADLNALVKDANKQGFALPPGMQPFGPLKLKEVGSAPIFGFDPGGDSSKSSAAKAAREAKKRAKDDLERRLALAKGTAKFTGEDVREIVREAYQMSNDERNSVAAAMGESTGGQYAGPLGPLVKAVDTDLRTLEGLKAADKIRETLSNMAGAVTESARLGMKGEADRRGMKATGDGMFTSGTAWAESIGNSLYSVSRKGNRFQRAQDALRESFAGKFAFNLGDEFSRTFSQGIERALGGRGNPIARALARTVDDWLYGAVNRTLDGLFRQVAEKKAKTGPGGAQGGLNIAGGKGGGIGGFLANAALSAGMGALLGGAFAGIGKGLKGIFKFAEGGRPQLGFPNLVGERGPELFVPDRPGTIIPNRALAAGMGGDMHFHGPLMSNVTISSDMDIDRVADRLAGKMYDRARRPGRRF